jgi:AraC-like DNA-binding protein
MKELLTADQKLINRLREIILDNLGNEKFSISELAQAAGMSSHRLNRKLYSTTKYRASICWIFCRKV